jgi:L,D-transpeptidase catalytic domain
MQVSARRRLISLLVGLTLSTTVGISLHIEQPTLIDVHAAAASSFQPQDVGDPSTTVLPDGSQQLVFWKNWSNHLVEAWYAGGSWNGPLDLTTAYFGGAAPLQSSPSAAVTPDGSTQLVFWQGPGGHLFEAWYAAASWHGPLDISAAYLRGSTLNSAASVTITPDGLQQMVFWRGAGNDLFEAWYASGSWHGPADLSAADLGGAGALASAPAVTVTRDGSTQLVYWQGLSAHLEEAWYAAGGWHGPLDLTAAYFGGNDPLASAPSMTTTVDGSQQLVYWQGAGQQLFEAWYAAGAWHGPLDLTAAYFGGKGPVTSAPSVAVTPDGSTQMVFWQGIGQSLWEAWYTGGWNGPHDFSPPLPCGAPVPRGRVITVSLSRQSAVFYQDGCAVNSSLVTTGRSGLRTPSGTFHVFSRSSPAHFVSAWPSSSPYYYSPETTQWALGYEGGGYFIHDAPWEPAGAFGLDSENGQWASHGCIHVPTAVMQWLYGWAGIGTTVIVTG